MVLEVIYVTRHGVSYPNVSSSSVCRYISNTDEETSSLGIPAQLRIWQSPLSFLLLSPCSRSMLMPDSALTVSGQLGPGSDDWGVPDQRAVSNRDTQRSSTRRLWRATSQAAGRTCSEARPSRRSGIFKPFLPVFGNTRADGGKSGRTRAWWR